MDSEVEPRQACEVSVLITNDEEIHALNRDYRGKDKPTDVLSFSQVEGPEGSAGSILGDIVISLPYAERQAPRYGNSLNEELLRLLVHGLLHLAGYDHENVPAAQAQAMRRKERALQKRYLAEAEHLS